ncbi:S-adenosyl-L-methionine-dependent methyltransferase [Dichomitus squalens]|uniref:S-adenosyl-L-methionine-dependent methyltransferase n=1 Tax=Dichomitus squalens TaxID=114155 RepID=A0A4Q9N081_9APHY|nr:S-adenosyl-L-methionine-dependent methyltransferase [Dichomitus squalens]
MSSQAQQKTNTKSNILHVALTRVAAIGVLLGLSLVTWAYRRALEPQYGSAPTTLHLSKIVWSASILGSIAPTVPLSRATLGLALLLYALPTSSYWVAAYTARLGDPILGPVATHLTVLLPVLSLGVALVKALQEAPYAEGDSKSPQSSITLPVCATAINSLQGLWPIVTVLSSAPEDQVFLQLGTAAMACWAIAPFLPDVGAPPPGATKSLAAAPDPATPDPRGKRKKGKHEKEATAHSTTTAPPPPVRKEASAGMARIRLALIPVLPYLTHTVLRGPTLPHPLLEPWTHPSYPLRILSSEQSAYSGVVVVGESLGSQNSSGIENMRYLRAGHSLLGGVWVGPKAVTTERDLLLQDAAGDKLGDSVYTAFILQEATLLAKKAGNARPKNALIVGLGTGIAATSFIRHNLSTTIVEIDPAVYDAARRFFGLADPHQVFLEDARGWVHNRSEVVKAQAESVNLVTFEPFDVVVHDCFSGGGIPSHLYTQQLWQELKNIIRSDAIIAVNYAGEITSDSAKAIVLTLRSVFPQCRAFYDAMEPSANAVDEFQNWVFFCTPSSEPLEFRKAVASDFLGSYLRRHILSSLEEREGDISGLGTDISEDKRERFILKDLANPLGDWQQKDAIHHWKIMRAVLPDVFWETY